MKKIGFIGAFDKTDFQKVKSKIRNYKKKRKRQNKKTSG